MSGFRSAVMGVSSRRTAARVGLRFVVVLLILYFLDPAFRFQGALAASATLFLYGLSFGLRRRHDQAADLLLTLGDLPMLFSLVHFTAHELAAVALAPAWLIGTTIANLRQGRPGLLPLHSLSAWVVVALHAPATTDPLNYLLMQSVVLAAASLVALSVVLERRANRTDSLTGVLTRRAGLEDLARLEGRRGLSLAFIDLRDFKRVNDEHGHAVGDEVLSIVARRLARALRRGDVLFRYGGDEFIAASGAPDLERRLREAFATPVRTRKAVLTVGARIGIQQAANGIELSEVVQEADRRMYADARRRTREEAVEEPAETPPLPVATSTGS